MIGPEKNAADADCVVEVVVAAGPGVDVTVVGGELGALSRRGPGSNVEVDVVVDAGAVDVVVGALDVVVVGAGAAPVLTRVPSPSRYSSAVPPGATRTDDEELPMSPPSGNTNSMLLPVSTGTRTLPLPLPIVVPG